MEQSRNDGQDSEPYPIQRKYEVKDKPPEYCHYRYGYKYVNTLLCRPIVGRSYLNADSFKIGHSQLVQHNTIYLCYLGFEMIKIEIQISITEII